MPAPSANTDDVANNDSSRTVVIFSRYSIGSSLTDDVLSQGGRTITEMPSTKTAINGFRSG